MNGHIPAAAHGVQNFSHGFLLTSGHLGLERCLVMVEVLPVVYKTDVKVIAYCINDFVKVVIVVVTLEPQGFYSLSVSISCRQCNLDQGEQQNKYSFHSKLIWAAKVMVAIAAGETD